MRSRDGGNRPRRDRSVGKRRSAGKPRRGRTSAAGSGREASGACRERLLGRGRRAGPPRPPLGACAGQACDGSLPLSFALLETPVIDDSPPHLGTHLRPSRPRQDRPPRDRPPRVGGMRCPLVSRPTSFPNRTSGRSTPSRTWPPSCGATSTSKPRPGSEIAARAEWGGHAHAASRADERHRPTQIPTHTSFRRLQEVGSDRGNPAIRIDVEFPGGGRQMPAPHSPPTLPSGDRQTLKQPRSSCPHPNGGGAEFAESLTRAACHPATSRNG